MDETLRQLGGLVLGAVPTVIFMLALYGIYTVLVHRPLVSVLAERQSKTEGAVAKARAAIAYAEARTSDYEQRLREARLAIFRKQEERRQKALQARTAVVAQARTEAQGQIESARAGIAQEKERAQAGLQAEAQNLASEIIQVVLQPAMAAQPRAGGAGE
ncbi:MAG TPA: ATP synthase F0 subunit B [Terriglobales bacterium]|nr:ATP synthase F0 subunit B [Terriglobales bacterium]